MCQQASYWRAAKTSSWGTYIHTTIDFWSIEFLCIFYYHKISSSLVKLNDNSKYLRSNRPTLWTGKAKNAINHNTTSQISNFPDSWLTFFQQRYINKITYLTTSHCNKPFSLHLFYLICCDTFGLCHFCYSWHSLSWMILGDTEIAPR